MENWTYWSGYCAKKGEEDFVDVEETTWVRQWLWGCVPHQKQVETDCGDWETAWNAMLIYTNVKHNKNICFTSSDRITKEIVRFPRS